MIDHGRLVTDQFSVRDYVGTAQSVTVQAARPVPAHHARLLAAAADRSGVVFTIGV